MTLFEKQIHIIFNFKERLRVMGPLLQHQPHKLYYFTAIIKDPNQKEIHLSYFNQNCSELEQKLPNLEIFSKEIDYTDYFKIIQELSKIIKRERQENSNSKIFINISTGSHITTLASIEASKLWNCNIYYASSTEYRPYDEEFDHNGEIRVQTPLIFPIQKPKEKYIRILQLIEKMIEERDIQKDYNSSDHKFVYKKELILKLFETSLLALQKNNKNTRKRLASQYMKSQKYLQPMDKELKVIKISKEKRNKKIRLTDKGKNLLEIFRYHF
ncbi:MAG: hypothetical protein BAJALOKI1v1_210027 [Promethearchaeota archaeon]|nr:MAG: hypothetical protein BAJALOKI1v1_210027 [Candidatus Lokiarchaeota archaeon]